MPSIDWQEGAAWSSRLGGGRTFFSAWSRPHLERAANALRGHGQVVDDTLLQYLSPLDWEHINLTGDYLWRSSAKIGTGKFRPLRSLQPSSRTIFSVF